MKVNPKQSSIKHSSSLPDPQEVSDTLYAKVTFSPQVIPEVLEVKVKLFYMKLIISMNLEAQVSWIQYL